MKQRIITAIVALLIFVPIVLLGDWPFILLVYAMATIGIMELMRMRKIAFFSLPSIVATVLVWIMLIPSSVNISLTITKLEVLAIFVFISLIYTVLVKNKFTFDDVGFMMIAALYISIGFYYFQETRLFSELGLPHVFFGLLIIWSTDTGAYFFGRSLGKRKLWPQISPNKTIGGALGGIFLALVVGSIYHFIFPMSHSFLIVVIVIVMASIFGQIGDLVASAYKRHYRVKDSGKLLPGHGGILDRMDSMLFVFPLLHLIQFF
ncbi:MAG TPA: phosphatidate cytidylyltransferase [Bacillota bacterium]